MSKPDEESVALTVNAEVPVAVGVPEISPLLLNESPAGNWPDAIVQVMGVGPPLAFRRAEYGMPTAPFGRERVLMSGLPSKVAGMAAAIRKTTKRHLI